MFLYKIHFKQDIYIVGAEGALDFIESKMRHYSPCYDGWMPPLVRDYYPIALSVDPDTFECKACIPKLREWEDILEVNMDDPDAFYYALLEYLEIQVQRVVLGAKRPLTKEVRIL